MTGHKSTRERFGAIFFAFVMVTSMVALGGFAGTAAGTVGTITEATAENVPAGQDSVTKQITLIGVDNTDTNSDTITIEIATDSDLTATDATVSDSGPYTAASTTANINSGDVEVTVPGENQDGDIVVDVTYDSSTSTAGSKTINVVSKTGTGSATINPVVYESNDAANPPSIVSVTKTAPQELTVEFSEGVTDADAADNGLVSGDFTYVNNNAGGATDITGESHTAGSSTLTLTTDNVITSSDVGSDEIFASADVQDIDDNSASQSTVAVQEPLAGDSNSDITTDIGGNSDQTLRAGSSAQSLGLIKIKDVSGGDSPLASRTILTMPDGVTINTAESSVLATTTSGGLAVTGTEIVDESTLRIDHSGSSDNGETIRVSGIVVDTASDVDASQGGTANAINVDYATGQLNSELLAVEKPQLQTGGTEVISAGAEGQDLTDNIGTISIQTGSGVDGQIANNTDIVINANQSQGITFDTDVDPTTITATTSGNAEVDMSSATLTETALTIPVTSHFAAGDSVSVDTDSGDDLLIDATGDAEDAKFSGVIVANGTTGNVALEQSNQNPDVNVQKPVVDIGGQDEGGKAGNLVIGASASSTSENFLTIGGNNYVQIDFNTDAPLSSGSDITIRTNRSDVSFDTGASVNPGTAVGTNGDAVDAEFSATDGGTESVNGITINQNEIVLDISNPGDVGSNSVLQIDDLPLVVDSGVEDEGRLTFTAETSPSSGTTVTASTDPDNDYVELDKPDSTFNDGNNETIDVDTDGETNVEINGAGGNALVIDSDEIAGQIGQDTTVEVSLIGSGVTFDQSVSYQKGGASDDSITQVQTGVTPDVIDNDAVSLLDSSTLTIDLEDSGASLGAGETITIDELFLNVTSDATNTELEVTTTTTSGNDVTATAGNVIEPNTVDPSSVFADANVDENHGGGGVGPAGNLEYSGTDSAEATDDNTVDDNPTVDETITSSIYVEDGGSAFGGANVDLEVVEQPNGSEGASFNTTTLTTNSNGVADYEFTVGDTTGTYVVNASTDSGSVNVTYEAVPGEAADVTVTPIENAIAGGTNEIGQAAFYVNATDANGNPVEKSPTVTLTADNVGTSEVAEFADKATVGSHNGLGGGTGDLSDGDAQFDIDGDGSSVVEVNTDTPQDVTITVDLGGNSDSSTVTFYENIGQLDLTLNESSVATGSTVTADATIAQTDGTVIEVPDVTVTYDDNSDANTTFAGGANSDTADTDASGVASVTVTAEQNGTSTIDAQTNLRSASATLTIDEQADTGSPLDGTAGEYDSDGDGQVTASELGSASTAFANGELTASELGDVAIAFANS